METVVMSEAVMSKIVVTSDVDETFSEVLAQIVRDGDEQAQMSLELLQEQVELNSE